MYNINEQVIINMTKGNGLEFFGGYKNLRKFWRKLKCFRPLRIEKHEKLVNTFYREIGESEYSYFLLACSTEEEAYEIMESLGYYPGRCAPSPYAETAGQLITGTMYFKIVGENRVLAERCSYWDI